MSDQDSGQRESLISAEADTARAVEVFFDGHPLGLQAHEWVALTLKGTGSFEVKVRRTQVAFRRRRGFAYLWLPGRWLPQPSAELVLSIALPWADRSVRFKEIAHPTPHLWMHHLEVNDLAVLDGQVAAWLTEAWSAAG